MVDFSQYQDGREEICGRKCPKCGATYYPEPMICTKCGARRDPAGMKYSEWEKVPLRGKCKLLTWTRLYNLPADFTDRFLVFGIVEFENGLRAAGQMRIEKPITGMMLVARTDVVRGSEDDGERGLIFEKLVAAEKR